MTHPQQQLIAKWRADADDARDRGYSEAWNTYQVCANELEAALSAGAVPEDVVCVSCLQRRTIPMGTLCAQCLTNVRAAGAVPQPRKADRDGHVWKASTKVPGFYDCALCGMFNREATKQHSTSCARMEPEDDVVIQAMCGAYVYNPNTDCTCGAAKCAGAVPQQEPQEHTHVAHVCPEFGECWCEYPEPARNRLDRGRTVVPRAASSDDQGTIHVYDREPPTWLCADCRTQWQASHNSYLVASTRPEHVCGLSGYNGMLDPPCPGCVANRRHARPAVPSLPALQEQPLRLTRAQFDQIAAGNYTIDDTTDIWTERKA